MAGREQGEKVQREGGFHGIFAELRGLPDLGDLAASRFFLSPPSLIMPHNLSVCPPSRAGGRLARKLAARLLFARVASQS